MAGSNVSTQTSLIRRTVPMLKKANNATILNYNCARNIALKSATMCDFAMITFQMITCTSVGMSLPQIVVGKYRVLYLTSVFREKIL